MTTATFVSHRDELIDFIKRQMVDQGATEIDAMAATTCVKFWSSKDVENLYRCINSDFPRHIINAIIAHDYNGLSRGDTFFLPKSTQFGDK